MYKFFETLKLTYWKKILSKSFIITTGILILLILGVANYDKIIKIFDTGPTNIAVITNNKDVVTYLNANKALIKDNMKFIEKTQYDKELKLLKNHKINAIYEVSEVTNHTFSIKIHTISNIQPSEIQALETLFTNFQLATIQKNLKLDNKELKLLNSKSDISIDQVSLAKTSKKYLDKEYAFLILFAYSVIVIMVFIIVNYSNQIALEIASEKTSRVIEMIITSVSPSIHLLAKISAIILAALTQLLLLLITIFISIKTVNFNDIMNKLNVEFNNDFWSIIIIGIILFIIGIVSYIILSAILGSLTSRIEDLTQSLIPVSLLALSSFYISFLNINNPESILVKITSFIPFFAPFSLLVRLINLDVSDKEIIIIFLINIIGIILMLIIAVSTYKNSVLSFEKNIFKTFKRRV